MSKSLPYLSTNYKIRYFRAARGVTQENDGHWEICLQGSSVQQRALHSGPSSLECAGLLALPQVDPFPFRNYWRPLGLCASPHVLHNRCSSFHSGDGSFQTVGNFVNEEAQGRHERHGGRTKNTSIKNLSNTFFKFLNSC